MKTVEKSAVISMTSEHIHSHYVTLILSNDSLKYQYSLLRTDGNFSKYWKIQVFRFPTNSIITYKYKYIIDFMCLYISMSHHMQESIHLFKHM